MHGSGTLGNDRYPSDIMQVIASLSTSPSSVSRTVRAFVGNAMHIPSALAVLLYGFTHIQYNLLVKLPEKQTFASGLYEAGHAVNLRGLH